MFKMRMRKIEEVLLKTQLKKSNKKKQKTEMANFFWHCFLKYQ